MHSGDPQSEVSKRKNGVTLKSGVNVGYVHFNALTSHLIDMYTALLFYLFLHSECRIHPFEERKKNTPTQFIAVLICVTVGGSFENSHSLWLQLISQACGQKWAAEPMKLTPLVCCKHRPGSWAWTQWPLPGP